MISMLLSLFAIILIIMYAISCSSPRLVICMGNAFHCSALFVRSQFSAVEKTVEKGKNDLDKSVRMFVEHLKNSKIDFKVVSPRGRDNFWGKVVKNIQEKLSQNKDFRIEILVGKSFIENIEKRNSLKELMVYDNVFLFFLPGNPDKTLWIGDGNSINCKTFVCFDREDENVEFEDAGAKGKSYEKYESGYYNLFKLKNSLNAYQMDARPFHYTQ